MKNIEEEVWVAEENPTLTKKLFPQNKKAIFSYLTNSHEFTDYVYSAYIIDQDNTYQPIIGWAGAAKEITFIGQTNRFRKFIKNKIPVSRKRLAFYFSLFTQSFEAKTNTLSLFRKEDDQTLITDKLFPETDGLIMWRHQMEKLFQHIGFSKKEAQRIQKQYQQGLKKETARKLREIKIDSLSLYKILQTRVPPRKASKLNYSTSKYFYDHFVKPKLN
ncbi:hypothetical protein [Fodinibius salsisoli]|uniref:Uncharacterized protein n=1 Tax=Fodinibius salsisoli TaxID=2820877 RepID=A0ABT3PIN6_9BACT|nr:hypothetical protein [Fodinibius salsisoli]MCW9705801.1 hypothetical protein [Fodinibius salsisoli]